MTTETTEHPTDAAQRLKALEAARADAAARYQAAAGHYTSATVAFMEAMRLMLAAGMEADHLARRLGLDGAPEMRAADHMTVETRLCLNPHEPRAIGAVDLVLEPARATARARLDALRAAGTLE